MVYDPVRDCEVPSPAVASRPYHPVWQEPPPSSSPSSAAAHHDHNVHLEHGQATSSSSFRPPSRGSTIRGLLNNDDGAEPRRDSGYTTVSSAHDDHDDIVVPPRASIAKLLNDPSSVSYPLVRSGSASSIVYESSSPRHSSPSASLYPSGFGPAIASRASRSPLPSPITTASALPHLESGAHYSHALGAGIGSGAGAGTAPSSRRSSMDVSRPMMPPSDPPRPGDMYTPVSHALSLRSPSISVSPRSQQGLLPPSRPGSSRSTSQPFGLQTPFAGGGGGPTASQSFSPGSTTRRLSDEPATGLAPASHVNGRRTMVLSAPPRVMYDPTYPSHSRTIGQPLLADELHRLRTEVFAHNFLRKRVRRPAPSWSAPSPRNSFNSTPAESDSSYFPSMEASGNAGPSRSRSQAAPSRRGSIASGAGDYLATPRGSAPYDTLPETPDTASQPQRGRKRNASPGPGNDLKRTSDAETDVDSRDVSRRKVGQSQGAYVGNAAAVASYYNARPDVGVDHREFSPIIGLKKFNNWIKSVLIGKFAFRQPGRPGAKVLDIGCGKGGDLNKWKQARIQLYVGMDLAETSVEQARGRYQTMNRPGFEGLFYAHDCYAKPISDILPTSLQHRDMYDNVTMQFCMHYAFETASKARMMIENVSRYLRNGGLFIGTIPNSALLLERLDEIPEDEPLEFGNACYSIAFTERKHKGMYGHAYRFYLEDAVEDVPEYIVHWDNFVNLALEYGLELVYKRTFNDVLQEEQSSRDFGPLLGKMGVINAEGESAMDSDQWEAANLYMAFAFEKRR